MRISFVHKGEALSGMFSCLDKVCAHRVVRSQACVGSRGDSYHLTVKEYN